MNWAMFAFCVAVLASRKVESVWVILAAAVLDSLQIRRSAVSIPANIAAGFRRRSSTEKTRVLNLAESSLEETRYYLILAQDLGYGDTATLMNSLEEVSRLLKRIEHRHSDCLDSWLLTSISRRDIKGRVRRYVDVPANK